MALPNKRPRLSPPNDDFLALGEGDEAEKAERYGYGQPNEAMQQNPIHIRSPANDPRHAKDRPRSKHVLPGYEPWVLVKTKYGRRFVHNVETKESFWHIPRQVLPGVQEYELWEQQQKEKEANAKWAEEQLKEMRDTRSAGEPARAANAPSTNRRRRSESLQREDEAAMLAELAADAERAEEEDVKDVVKAVEPLQPLTQQATTGYNSDSSYEEVEVTDSEFEEEEGENNGNDQRGHADDAAPPDDGPLEFDEDDIAYQLAAMEEDFADEAEEGEDNEGAGESDDDQELTLEDAINLFRDMLDDHRISPFTPWDKLLADESDTGIILDDRYTALPNMRARKEAWEGWVRDTAAKVREERARMEKSDPRIPYLAFLAEKATPKLYWPEFKRKYKKESEMTDRKLGDKEREKLYRDHINRLKLPQSTRKADLITLLKEVPLQSLHREVDITALPQQVLSHLHFISLPASERDELVLKHISTLPPAPDGSEAVDEARRAEEDKKREERRRREKALADREHKVEEDRRRAEKEERWAKRDLREEERELRRAMDVGRNGIKTHLEDDRRVE